MCHGHRPCDFNSVAYCQCLLNGISLCSGDIETILLHVMYIISFLSGGEFVFVMENKGPQSGER